MKQNSVMHMENGEMPVCIPEEVGIKSEDILHFFDAIKKEGIALHSFQLVRHGKLVVDAVAKPYTHDSFHRIFSAAKGVVATAVLLAIEEGYFDFDSLVIPLLPKEWIPDNLDERWNRLTIYHLLTMTDGHEDDAMFKMMQGSTCWIKTFFEVPIKHEPGTFFCYDMGAQYVMNELVAICVGKNVGEYLDEKIWRKMGIDATWKLTNPENHFWSSSIQMKPDGLTKMALLYLQEGEWNGEQLIRKDLMEIAAQPQGPSGIAYTCGITEETLDDIAGYGLHMWRNTSGGYRFCGGQGQLGMVYPEYDLVASTFGAVDNCDRIDELFDRFILHHCWARPQTANMRAYKKLQDRIKNFSLGVEGSDMSSISADVSHRQYVFDENEFGQKSISFSFEKTYVKVLLESSKGRTEHIIGLNDEWKENKGYVLTNTPDGSIVNLDLTYDYDPCKTLMTGAWKTRKTFEFVLRSSAMMCEYRYFCTFNGSDLEIEVKTTCHSDPIAFMGEASSNPHYVLFASEK